MERCSLVVLPVSFGFQPLLALHPQCNPSFGRPSGGRPQEPSEKGTVRSSEVAGWNDDSLDELSDDSVETATVKFNERMRRIGW